jgi:hypothetical protein
MKLRNAVLCCAVALFAVSLVAQDPAVPASSNQPPIYAQKLVNETLAKNNDVIIMALHVTPPNQTENIIIASNIGRIGKKADEDDLRVINTGATNLEVNKTGNHFEVELPLLDQNGTLVGAAGIVFNYKAGDDKQKLQKRAEQVRDEMRKKIASREKLFDTVKE